MKRNLYSFFILLSALFLFSGCAVLAVGGAAVSAGTGTFLYIDGELKTDYAASFDKTWSACEKMVADMRGMEVRPVKEIAQGKITTVINDEKVKIEVTYRTKDQTNVSIRVGLVGDKLSSQRLHDKIAENLAKN
ncbi:MAG: hypothetical protein CVU71_05225 [Deltaproteobacteria bacterium HGW-Deltaproteobacteria-6]|nr:MAG: hypothetical protein CVU71_05225 [Deltaproteobacteria bacterium HGW-Deltaproteobacteria-6]